MASNVLLDGVLTVTDLTGGDVLIYLYLSAEQNMHLSRTIMLKNGGFS